jgi:hypothetical protein
MLKKLKVTSHAFIFCLFGFTLMTVFLFSPNVYAQSSDTDMQNRINSHDESIYQISEKLSEFEKDVSTEFTKLTEDGIQKTNQINDLAQNIRNIFRDGRTRSDEIDALQERIKMLEDRLAKKTRNKNTLNLNQLPIPNTLDISRPMDKFVNPDMQPNQQSHDNPQGFSSAYDIDGNPARPNQMTNENPQGLSNGYNVGDGYDGMPGGDCSGVGGNAAC